MACPVTEWIELTQPYSVFAQTVPPIVPFNHENLELIVGRAF